MKRVGAVDESLGRLSGADPSSRRESFGTGIRARRLRAADEPWVLDVGFALPTFRDQFINGSKI